MIKTVIFDIDGTLYDYDQCHQIGMESLKEYVVSNLKLSAEEFQNKISEAEKIAVSRTGNNHAACQQTDPFSVYVRIDEDATISTCVINVSCILGSVYSSYGSLSWRRSIYEKVKGSRYLYWRRY